MSAHRQTQVEAPQRCAATEKRTDKQEVSADLTEPEYDRLVQELVNDAKGG